MKKWISMFLAFLMLQSNFSCVFAEENVRESFVVDVSMLSRKQIDNIPQNFKKLDLTSFANRDIKDEVAGDGTGGWSDQGDNDLRMFNMFGAQEMLGVPFDFIDPSKNNNKAVLGLRGQNDMELPTSVDIPVNSKTAGAYFVHASPWAAGVCGTYSWVYKDGSEAYVDIEKNVYICDFWGKSSYDYCRAAWTATKADGSQRSLYLFAMNNPYPDKEVDCLRLSTAGGGAYIMIMAITLTNSGPYLEQVESAKYRTVSTYGWYPYTYSSAEQRKDSVLDFSHLLDAPAGKHGKVLTKGSQFVFEDGTDAVFYGVDIVGEANFPTKDDAEKIAKEIAMDGVNLVRMREIDNIIYGNSQNHSSFDEEMKDRFMFFVSELKKNGIYVYLSVFSDYELYESDNIKNYQDFKSGLGFDGFWDEQLIELQKTHLKKLMTEKNSYTGMTLLEDPAVAMLEFADSKSIMDFTTGWGKNSLANKEQQEKLNIIFNEFLKDKYKTTSELEQNWTEYDKNSEQTIEKGNIIAKPSWKSVLHSDKYRQDMSDFLIMLEMKYYDELNQVVQGKITTSNSNKSNTYSIYDLKISAQTDFTARNSLFADILNISDKLTENAVLEEYDSPVSLMESSTILSQAQNAVYNQPFVCGYGGALPNLYFSAENVMVTAFAGQNNWLLIQYSYANGDYDSSKIDDAYTIYDTPVKKVLLPILATLYYSMKPLDETRIDVSSDKNDAAYISPKDAYTKNVRVALGSNGQTSDTGKNLRVIKTNNIYWDSENGIFEVRTPKAEAMTGFYSEKEDMPSFAIDTDSLYITAALSSADNQEIQSSDCLLFTVLCGNQNTGHSVNIVKNAISSVGKAPVLVQGISGTVVLKLKGNYEVWALDSNGQRTSRVDTKINSDGYAEFDISSDYKTVQYEIRRK